MDDRTGPTAEFAPGWAEPTSQTTQPTTTAPPGYPGAPPTAPWGAVPPVTAGTAPPYVASATPPPYWTPPPLESPRRAGRRRLPGWVLPVVCGLGGLVAGGVVGAVVGMALAGIPLEPGLAYGDSALLDRAYDQCRDGELSACDLMYDVSDHGSEYESFGSTCGNRREPNIYLACIDDNSLGSAAKASTSATTSD